MSLMINIYLAPGVQIVEICLATRPHNGGLINLQELCALLRQKRKSDREAVSEDDCLRAISKLKVCIKELLWYVFY
jgi:ESCRT-II complex subunit VPS22